MRILVVCGSLLTLACNQGEIESLPRATSSALQVPAARASFRPRP